VGDQEFLDGHRPVTVDLAAGLAQDPGHQVTPLVTLGVGEFATEDQLVRHGGRGLGCRFSRLV
jgi:hypothetical protein